MNRSFQILICPGFSSRHGCQSLLRTGLRSWFSFGENQIIFYVLSEAIKNIYDHAESCGQVILLLRGKQLFFSVRDYNPNPVDLETIIEKGVTSKPESGINCGNGIYGAGWLTEIPKSEPRMLNYRIDSTAGLHYSGIWQIE